MAEDNSAKYVQLLSDLTQRITNNKNEETNRINQHFDTIIATLNTRRNELIDTISTNTSTFLDEIKNEIVTVNDNNNLNSTEYFAKKISSWNKSHVFKTSELDFKIGTIEAIENKDIMPSIKIIDIIRNSKKPHPYKCWIIIQFAFQNQIKDVTNKNSSFKCIKVKYRKMKDTEWLVAEYDSIENISENNFQCILKSEYFLQFDQKYVFQIEYETKIPLQLTLVSDLKPVCYSSGIVIDNIISLKKYCNWYEYSPINATRKMFQQWTTDRNEILKYIKYFDRNAKIETSENNKNEEKDEMYSTYDQLKKVKVRQLKQWLKNRNINSKSCIEKSDFVNLILKTQRSAAYVKQKNEKKQAETMGLKFHESMKNCQAAYMQYLKENSAKLSYSLYDFLQENAVQHETDKLLKILEYELDIDAIYNGFTSFVDIIASYSAVIYAKPKGAYHNSTSYYALFPNKHMFENITFASHVSTNVGEVVAIFEQHHPDLTKIKSNNTKYKSVDIVLYYSDHNTYCVLKTFELVNCKLHRDYALFKNIDIKASTSMDDQEPNETENDENTNEGVNCRQQ